MAQLFRELHFLSDGSVEVVNMSPPPVLSGRVWRVNHDPQPLWRTNLPEVFRLDPDIHVVLTEERQWLWRNINPQLTDRQWSACLDNELAFTNHTGFPGTRNYILNEDMDSDKDPRFDQVRVCGGALLRGLPTPTKLLISAIDLTQPLPTPQQVIDNGWYFEAVNIDYQVFQDGRPKQPVIRRFKPWGLPVYVPIFCPVAMSYPMSLLTEVDPDNLPSPYQYP